MRQAADEIEKLTVERDALQKALDHTITGGAFKAELEEERTLRIKYQKMASEMADRILDRKPEDYEASDIVCRLKRIANEMGFAPALLDATKEIVQLRQELKTEKESREFWQENANEFAERIAKMRESILKIKKCLTYEQLTEHRGLRDALVTIEDALKETK